MKTGIGRQHDRGNPGRHALFRPEQQAVIDHEDAHRQKRSGNPLASRRRRRTLQAHPCKEHESSREETHAGEK